MFANKDKNIVNRRGTSPENKIKSFLGAGSVFEGRMVFIENMRLDGTFRGEIASDDILIVGDNANLQAEVMVGTLIISGCFQGNIKAKMRVELRAPAQVNGVIEAPAISIEDGVTFNGTLKMNGHVETEAHKKVAA
jgi:cytoskeletal protein CcmA (bactofilin family)